MVAVDMGTKADAFTDIVEGRLTTSPENRRIGQIGRQFMNS